MDLSKHLERAEDAVKRRNYSLAAGICNQLLAVQPDAGEARALLRRALFKKAETKPTPKALAVVAGAPHLLTLGLCRAMGKHAAAAKAAERYLALDPHAEAVNLKLGESLQRAGHRRSALAVYRAYAEAHPRCASACRQAGALLYEAGELEAALEMYENALKVDPRDQEALKARKNLAAEGALKKSGLAEAKSSRELIKDKEGHARMERESRLQLSAEEVDSELERIEGELAERPDDVKLLVRAADLRAMDKDLAGALDCLERALQVAPDRSDLADRTGDLRLDIQRQRVAEAEQSGDDGSAERARAVLSEMTVAEYRRRVQAHPTDFGLRYELGSALLEVGQVDEAIAELQQAIKDPRRKVESRMRLADAFREKGLPDLAMGQLEQARQAAGEFGDRGKQITYQMGCVAEDLGQPEVALRHFARVLEQDIGYRDVSAKVESLRARQQT